MKNEKTLLEGRKEETFRPKKAETKPESRCSSAKKKIVVPRLDLKNGLSKSQEQKKPQVAANYISKPKEEVPKQQKEDIPKIQNPPP